MDKEETMSARVVTSPSSIHPALSNPFPSLSFASICDNSDSNGAGSTTSTATGSGSTSVTSASVRPKSSQALKGGSSQFSKLSLDTAKSILRNPDPSEPSSAAPALESTTQQRAAEFLQKPRGHHKNALSIESIPRQTMIKALAGIGRKEKPEALSLGGLLSNKTMTNSSNPAPGQAAGSHHHPALNPGLEPRPGSAQTRLSDALSELASRQNMTPATAFPSLQSPCFYHERFDDAVDLDKVLEEIKNDEYMSHSRLVQTATSVREVSKQLQRRPIKRAVRNVMIVTKAKDNQLVYLTSELTQWLMRTPRYGNNLGVNVYVDAKLRNSKRFNAAGIVSENKRFGDMLRYWTPDLCWSQPEKFDLVLTLGGDGTVLFTSWLFQRIVPPTLSFSLGSLGFLTTFEYEKFREHLDRVMGSAGMKVNLRMRFTCTVYRDGASANDPEEGEQFEVLNELVIDRGPSPYVSNLELYGDNELLTVVQADGCIFSTPTGSTAYSLSAGGSLVHPDIPAILLTPICPHTLSFRPMVLSDTMLLRVSIPKNSRATAYCAFDGKGRVELRQGDHVTITASQYPFPTVTRTDAEWFDSVSRTLRWNTRAATQKGFDATGAEEEGKEEFDIDTDSACYASEEGSTSASPLRRQMSLLGM